MVGKMPRSIRRVSLVMFLYFLSWSLVEPFLPVYFKQLFGTFTAVSLVTALLYVFSIFWAIPYGKLIDDVSNKKLVSLILLLYLPMGPLLAILRTVGHFVYYRIFHAFLATGLWTTTEAYIRRNSPKEESAEAIGFFDSTVGFSILSGSILGGLIANKFGIVPLFYFMPVFVLFAFIASFFLPDLRKNFGLISEVKHAFSGSFFVREIKEFFTHPGIAPLAFIEFILAIAMSIPIILLPLFSDSLGASFMQIGLIFALFNLPTLLEAPFSLLGDRHGRKRMMLIGSTFAAFLFLVIFFIRDLTSLFIGAMLLSAGFAMVLPSLEGAMTLRMPANKKGQFTAVSWDMRTLGAALGIFAVGPLADIFSVNAPFLLGVALMVIVFLVTIFWLKR